jgi:hypothetical protein
MSIVMESLFSLSTVEPDLLQHGGGGMQVSVGSTVIKAEWLHRYILCPSARRVPGR